ncbi:MAG TPA: NAD(P)H-dependent oxidoreductase [Acidimicrobiales bacterium]|nr:NAD(P)H-dependent oxidoreductase [Acidimicrobiales bacterium]
MSPSPLTVAVIVGSTREGRFADVVVDWFLREARTRTDMVFDLVDLAVVGLPAALPRRRSAEVQAYVDRIGRADAFVVVTPEYNHGYPAPLKQAIDIPYTEWRRKPVAFVSYGGVAAGQRAVEQLRPVFAELHAATVRETVALAMAHGLFDEAGRPRTPEASAAVATMLDDLAWWGTALRAARTATAPTAAAGTTV